MEYNPKFSSRMTPVLNIFEIIILFLSGGCYNHGNSWLWISSNVW